MAQAVRDENRIPTLIGVDDVTYQTPTTVAVDPVTHGLIVSGIDGSVIFIAEQPYTILRDDSDANTTYYGITAVGNGGNTAGSVWRIVKVFAIGTTTSFKWANGSDSFTNIWNNRSTYSYS